MMMESTPETMPFEVLGAHIDTIVLLTSGRPTADELAFLGENSGGARQRASRTKDRWRVIVDQPRSAAFMMLDKLAEKYTGKAQCLEAALELRPTDARDYCAEQLARWLRERLVMLNSQGVGLTIESTTYSSKRRFKVNRVVSYPALSKLCAGEIVVRVELQARGCTKVGKLLTRLKASAAVPSTIMAVDPTKAFRNLVLEEVDDRMLGRQHPGRGRAKKPELVRPWRRSKLMQDDDVNTGCLCRKVAEAKTGVWGAQAVRRRWGPKQTNWFRPETSIMRIARLGDFAPADWSGL